MNFQKQPWATGGLARSPGTARPSARVNEAKHKKSMIENAVRPSKPAWTSPPGAELRRVVGS